MILSEMISKIETGIQDPSFTAEDDILPLINEALELAADEFPHAGLASPAVIDVTAGDAGMVFLPDDYHHDLYRVRNTTFNQPVSIRSNLNVLEKLYDGFESSGPIADVAVEGTELYFKPTPVEETQQLTILYYKKPVDLEADDDTPGWLPSRFHQGIIVDYALKELWALIEDGIDGQKVNTAFYESRYEQSRGKLAYYTRRNPRQRPVIERIARFF